MKRLLLLISFIMITFQATADAGQAWRYEVEVQTKDNHMHKGYIYLYTLSEKFDASKSSFFDYISKNYPKTAFNIYTEVKTLSTSDGIELDFFIPKNRVSIGKDKVDSMQLIKEMEFTFGDRVKEVSDKEYDRLKKKPKGVATIYHEAYVDNCSIILVYWSKEKAVINEKKVVDTAITKILEDKSLTKTDKRKKIDALLLTAMDKFKEQGVLCFGYCDAR